MPGTYNFTPRVRGDTFLAFQIATLTDETTADPIAVTSARLQVRRAESGNVVLRWGTVEETMSISGAGNNVITMLERTAATMAKAYVGVHVYDLEVVLATGTDTVTILSGTFEILADVTQ